MDDPGSVSSTPSEGEESRYGVLLCVGRLRIRPPAPGSFSRCLIRPPRIRPVTVLWAALTLVVLAAGCTSDWIKVRAQPDLPLARELDLFSWSGPKPSARTMQFLRRHDLVDQADADPRDLMEQVHGIVQHNPTPESVYAYAELAYIGGNKLQEENRLGDALDLYAASVAQAYEYLVGDDFALERNPYDPLFRAASDLYNGSLENALRIVRDRGKLLPGTTYLIQTETRQFEVQIVCKGRWKPADFERLEFVSDYDVQGLRNHYRSYGLGVSLIAVHSGKQESDPAARYYSPGMSFPVTAFLRMLPGESVREQQGAIKHFCVLELYDPLDGTDIMIGDHSVPLETDLTTPLAFSLNDPVFRRSTQAIGGLLNTRESQGHQGLYMLEPYDPHKIPVLMIHGFWSTLVTWMEMFNDLRGTPEIRNNYQFWFYLYPTGQPFWITAAQLRRELAQLRQVLDPEQTASELDQMILVGHSMGGLIARMQAVDSRDDFWKMISDEPVGRLDLDEELVELLSEGLVFDANPSVQRVVTIASPHRGSRFSNNATRWLGRKVINLPDSLMRAIEHLAQDGPPPIKDGVLKKLQTSIDTLSPESPILPVLLRAHRAPWVYFHNIVGVTDDDGVVARLAGDTDGIVTFESAHLDDVASEIVVASDHVNVHRHPRTVLEIQRILLEHLAEARAEMAQPRSRPRLSRLPPIHHSKLE
jgi:pimeloyl-ACP methyl ester carboxylesterase